MQDGWIPNRVFWKDGRPMVGWCFLGDRRLAEPFFESTIEYRLAHPFHHAFGRETPIEALAEWSRKSPGIQPRGFIFHQSRCGSTLICRMLAALERNVVLSEPPPLDSILRAHLRHPAVSRDQRVEWLRWMVSALGQKRAGGEDRLFVKFDAWSVADLPLIRQAFPETPWIFLYREPIEVLVSHLRRPARWAIPGVLHPAMLGLDLNLCPPLPVDEYRARVLSKICHFGLAHHRSGGGLLVNYEQLPEFVGSGLAGHFGIRWSYADIEGMRAVTGKQAKEPGASFTSDSQGKREAATGREWELARQWLEPAYQALEAARQEAVTR